MVSTGSINHISATAYLTMSVIPDKATMIAALHRAKWTGSILQDGVFTIPFQNRMKPHHNFYCHDTSISISHSFTVILAVVVICDLSETSQLPPI